MARRYGYGRNRSDRWSGAYSRWAPYVPVAKRRAQAVASAKSLEKQLGRGLAPIKIEGRTIARSFWGQAWCDNMEAYSDFSNRLPRGRTYVRNGSVIDLAIAPGTITAMVSGSSLYNVKLTIARLPPADWKAIQRDCARSISSLIDLLQGRFDKGVMQRLTQPAGGLFPKPREIKMECSCPDYAGLCKHIAAVLYGVGARLDAAPELLFTLRNVDHLELIGQAVDADNLDRVLTAESGVTLESGDLGEMFGIELETRSPPNRFAAREAAPAKPARRPLQAATKSRAVTKARAVKKAEVLPPRSQKSPPKKPKRQRNDPVAAMTTPVATLTKPAQTKKPAATAGSEPRITAKRSVTRPVKTSQQRRPAK